MKRSNLRMTSGSSIREPKPIIQEITLREEYRLSVTFFYSPAVPQTRWEPGEETEYEIIEVISMRHKIEMPSSIIKLLEEEIINELERIREENENEKDIEFYRQMVERQ